MSVFDLLKNAEFFKKLYAMKEKADASVENLGVDVERFKKEIADEYNKNPDAKGKTILTFSPRPSGGFRPSNLRH